MKIVGKDYDGKIYPSLQKMYDFYKKCGSVNVSYSAFLKRLDNGWSIKETLTGRPRKGISIYYRKETYPSVMFFCKQHGISHRKFRYYLKRLKNVQETLCVLAEQQQRKKDLLFFYLVLPALIHTISEEKQESLLQKKAKNTDS